MSRNVAEILDGCRLFSALEPEGFARLVTIARLVKFRKGELIFREGQECPGVYVVGSGLVRVFKTSPQGKEHVLHMVTPGQTFAEVAAIGGFDVPASAEAVAPTTCVLLPLDRFRAALEQDHGLCLGMLAGLTLWVRHLVCLMEDVVLRDAAGRLARYLLDAEATPDGLIELPTLKRHLASHLNLTSETFSRTLRRLVDAGLVAEPDGNHVQLLDRDALQKVAEGLAPRV
jgi:CRP/FNR family transcriptional regulator